MRLLVLGLGAIGQRHVRAARRVKPGIEVLALRSKKGLGYYIDDKLDAKETTSIARELGIYETESRDVASQFKATHILDSRIPSVHLKRLGGLSDKKSMILVEKPLSCLRLECVERLATEEGLDKKRIFVGYHLLGSSSVKRLREELSCHRVRRYHLIHNEHIGYFQSFRTVESMHEAKMSLSGGIQYSFSHGLQLVNSLFGAPKLVGRDSSAKAMRKLIGTDIFPTEHLALQHTEKGQEVYGRVDLAFDSHEPRFQLLVYCVDATFVVNFVDNCVSKWSGHKRVHEVCYPKETKVKLLEKQMQRFLDLQNLLT